MLSSIDMPHGVMPQNMVQFTLDKKYLSENITGIPETRPQILVDNPNSPMNNVINP
jgi:hypothetical protein